MDQPKLQFASDSYSESLQPGLRARFFDVLMQSRSHRVICLVMGIWILNGFDLVLTIMAHEQGLLHEANPLARQVLDNGVYSIVLYKVGLLLIGSYPLLKFRRATITELGSLVVLMAYMTLAFRWSVCYELYAVTATSGSALAEVYEFTRAP